MKKILVTGASARSFAGRRVYDALREDYEALAPHRAELDLTSLDSVWAYLKSNPVDAVVHCAVQGERSENELDADLRMFFNLVNAREYYGKLVYFGSGAEFDKSMPIDGLSEEAFGRSIPKAPYGFSKYIMNEYARTQKNIVNLRLFSGYGITENYKIKFISGLCCKALLGLPLTIRQDCLFDFVWLEDIVRVVRWAVETDCSRSDYNLSSGVGIYLSEAARIVKEESGGNSDICVLNEGSALPYVGDNSRLAKESGIVFTPIRQGIKTMLQYFEENIDFIDKESLTGNR